MRHEILDGWCAEALAKTMRPAEGAERQAGPEVVDLEAAFAHVLAKVLGDPDMREFLTPEQVCRLMPAEIERAAGADLFSFHAAALIKIVALRRALRRLAA